MSHPVDDPFRALADISRPDERHLSGVLPPLEYLHAELDAIQLHDGVPAEVRQLFETAKNVSLYTWFVYRFHQVAEMAGYGALEYALRIKGGIEEAGDNWKPSLRHLLIRARDEGWLTNKGFAERRAAYGVNRARDRKHRAAFAQFLGKPGPEELYVDEPTLEEIATATEEVDVVAILIKFAPDLRNRLAHGSAILTPNSPSTLTFIAEAINQLFPMPGAG